MNKIYTWILLSLLWACSPKNKHSNMDTEAVKNVVYQYIKGAFGDTDIEAFKKAFHPQFAIANPQADGKLFFFTRDMWEQVLLQRKQHADFDYKTIALVPRFRTIDVQDDRASVSLDLLLGDKIVYTDFLLLVRVEAQWTIVSKVYHEHP